MLPLCPSSSPASSVASSPESPSILHRPLICPKKHQPELLSFACIRSAAMAMTWIVPPSSSVCSPQLQPLSSSSSISFSPYRQCCFQSHEFMGPTGALHSSRRSCLLVMRCAGVEVPASSPVLPSSPQSQRRIVGRGSKLIGCGSAVPKRILSNDDLSKIVDTNDEWITVRTGIRTRRVLSDGETVTSLAVESAKKALDMARLEAEDIDLILLCTSSPDDLFGSAPQVQRELGCAKALAFDITAACSGFVLGLVTGTRFIKGGGFHNVLVIGADALSRYVDWTDRGTCILFGDAAGALVLQASSDEQDSLLGFDFHSDGHGHKHLNVRMSASEVAGKDEEESTNGAAIHLPAKAAAASIQMNGREVFKFAVQCVPQAVKAAMKEAGLVEQDLDWLLLHQANKRILDAVSERLQIPSERVISNLANYGNTSAASIPLALDEAVRCGKIKPGDILATAGFGAGLTWGSAIIKWG